MEGNYLMLATGTTDLGFCRITACMLQEPDTELDPGGLSGGRDHLSAVFLHTFSSPTWIPGVWDAQGSRHLPIGELVPNLPGSCGGCFGSRAPRSWSTHR